MRPTLLLAGILAGTTLASSVLAPTASAGPMWGRNGYVPARQTLPPAGEGRRDWLKLNCYGCHGINAGGGIGPNVQHAEGGDVSEAVLQGESGGMPSFRKYVTATDIKNIDAYLKSIGTRNEPTWVDWWNAIP